MNVAAARPFPRRRRWDAGLRSPSRLTAASAPCYIGVPGFPPRVGGVRLPRGRVTKEPKRRMGRVVSVRQPRVGGGWWIGCDDASALLPGINAASTGAFAFTDVDMNTWVATTLSIMDLVDLAIQQPQPPHLSAEGSERMRESHRWKASGPKKFTRCLSGERECTRGIGQPAFTPNGATDAYRPHPPAIGAE